MRLILDLGNTNSKLAVFSDTSLMDTLVVNREQTMSALLQLVEGREDLFSAIVGATAHLPKGLEAFLTERFYTVILDHHTPLPIKNRYATPATLGRDRLAAAVGAHGQWPDRAVLIIDAGTCVTYDLVNASGEYLGGGIAPGLRIRFESLHTFTDKLPLIEAGTQVDLVGDSTAASIRSGVQLGLLAEVEGMIRNYRDRFPELQVVLTGGDAGFFANALKNSIFADQNLVLAGLNDILRHNEGLQAG